MILVILAGGIGSRFGGLKQLEPVDNEGNFILDYSIFDAVKAGFEKVVFIIKEENYLAFKETIGNRVEKHIKTIYAFQNNENISSQYKVPSNRTKPFGTAHALLCAESVIDDNFLVINADDFYGQGAFQEVSLILNNSMPKNEYVMVGYNLEETLSDSGNVKRGICSIENDYLNKIEEFEIAQKNGDIFAKSLEKEVQKWQKLNHNHVVSMNMMAFDCSFFKFLKDGFVDFLEQNKNDLSSAEYFLPTLVDRLIESDKIKMRVVPATSKWQGITYREDLAKFKKFISLQKKFNVYPKKLWD